MTNNNNNHVSQIETNIYSKIFDNYNEKLSNLNKNEKDQMKFKCLSTLVNYIFKNNSNEKIYKVINSSINMMFSLYDDYPVDIYSSPLNSTRKNAPPIREVLEQEFIGSKIHKPTDLNEESPTSITDSEESEEERKAKETILRFDVKYGGINFGL